MIVALTVQNFAIIDNITIEFSEGMTVLTGETGAGKSLVIDAIGLLFGRRASTDLIRFGENKAVIEGIFSEYPAATAKIIDITAGTEDYLVIRREIHANGKSICKINNNIVTLSLLAEIAEELGDIHTQFDTQGLFKPKNYLQFIDNREVNDLLEEYQVNLAKYREVSLQFKKLSGKSDMAQQNLELLQFQKTELAKAKISEEEEITLKARSTYLSNFEEISHHIKAIIDLYREKNILADIYQSILALTKLVEYDPKYSNYKTRLEEYYYGLEDLIAEISRDYKEFEYDENEFDRINERLTLYADLKRKYRRSTAELTAFYREICDEIDKIENYDYHLSELKKQKDKAYQETLAIAKTIRAKRMVLAEQLTSQIKTGLADLQLKNTEFKIIFNDTDSIQFKNDGIDVIDFMISFNPGEPLRPLSKVASGGELSRFMLALKTLVFEKIKLQTVVFDEIDIGVSGAIAHSIAHKIKQIASKVQVLCVTHLPQVAATADNHLSIAKKVTADRTVTLIANLDKQSRIDEIGKMISNGEATPASKALAAELLTGKKIN